MLYFGFFFKEISILYIQAKTNPSERCLYEQAIVLQDSENQLVTKQRFSDWVVSILLILVLFKVQFDASV